MTETPFPDDPPDGLVVRLLHAATRETLAARISEADFESGTYPSWVAEDEDERSGLVTVGAEDSRHLRMTLRAKFIKERVAVKVVIEGLYEVDVRSSVLVDGDQMYDRVPAAYRQTLAQVAVEELFPYLREAVHSASASVLPINPILLQPPGGATEIPLLD